MVWHDEKVGVLERSEAHPILWKLKLSLIVRNGGPFVTVMVVDEIDKALLVSTPTIRWALYSLLEHDTGQTVRRRIRRGAGGRQPGTHSCKSHCQRERAIPEPILNRVNVYQVQAPDRDAARTIARRLYTGILSQHDWGRRFDPEPAADVLDQLAELAPREMRRAWMMAFGNARLDGRGQATLADLPAAAGAGKRGPLGFMN